LHIEWQATGPFVDRGKDATVAPTEAAAFLARSATARSTAEFEVAESGVNFRSDPGVSTDQGFAKMGREPNGVFLL
jgi:hypothetical protein